MYREGNIANLKNTFVKHGIKVKQKTWQSIQSPDDTFELSPVLFEFPIPETVDELHLLKPQLPWAENHFEERIGGLPLNPGNEYKNWRFYQRKPEDDKFRNTNNQFSHSYMERIWPKLAGRFDDKHLSLQMLKIGLNISINKGIRYNLGDLGDIIELLRNDPTTRQAYLPIWFPEDTGNVMNERVPCTLGYHFYNVRGKLDCHYYIRSCDYLRHFRDDVYLASRLTQYVGQTTGIPPGKLYMHITSLHVFYNERGMLKQHNT